MPAKANRSASTNVEVDAITAKFGAQYIEARTEAVIAGHALLDLLAKHADDYDAVVWSEFW